MAGKKYAVIGGGLAGLTAAWQIRQLDADAHIDVYEAADRLGGKLHTVPFADGPIDVGSEAFLVRRPDMREFVEELGLSDAIVTPSAARSVLYLGGSSHPMPTATVMGIPATSEAVRGLVSEETLRRIDAEGEAGPLDWVAGEDRSVGELVRDRYGADVVPLVSALLGGVYSCTADDLGVRATIPQLAAVLDKMEHPTLSGAVGELLRARAGAGKGRAAGGAAAGAQPAGSAGAAPAGAPAAAAPAEPEPAGSAPAAPAPAPAKPAPIFGAFAEGYQTLYERLAESADVYVDAFITSVGRPGAWSVEGRAYDELILATPAPTTARLVAPFAPELAELLAGIELASSAVVAMKFDSDAGLPQNSGLLVATGEPNMHAKAFTFVSRKWPHIGERGGAVVRASFGRYGDDAIVRADEDTLVDSALDDLQRATGFDGRAAGLSEIYVQRWFGGIPRYDAGHTARIAAIRTHEVPGLQLTGAWSSGVGVPAVIAGAREAARTAVRG